MIKQLTYFCCFQEDFSYALKRRSSGRRPPWSTGLGTVLLVFPGSCKPGFLDGTTLVRLGSDLKESQLDTGMGQEWNHLRVPSKSGLWFGTVSIFPFSREFHFIPTDLFIFLRGVGIPQPPTRNRWQIDRSSDLLVACGPPAQPRFCRVWLASFSFLV